MHLEYQVYEADFVPLTYLNTKRYARLVVRNVRNFAGKRV